MIALCSILPIRILLALVFSGAALAQPYVDGKFRGRIAWSADGNHNDPDDWIASPMALAIFAEAGVRDRLVHFDYNCIRTGTNPAWEKIHAESVLGAAQRWGYAPSVFIDVQKDGEAAIASIARAINASTIENPLYLIVAGPMEIPYLGIQRSDPARRKFVHCISHSRWNEGYASNYSFTFTKRSVIEQGINWVQIRDQNPLLAFGKFGKTSPPEEYAPYFWLRDSSDPKLQFLWERMLISTRPDPSDAGMAWFLVTGDEACDPQKLRQLLHLHHAVQPTAVRDEVRIEAENFAAFHQFGLEDRGDRQASHRLNVVLKGGSGGYIRTRFVEPYVGVRERYDVQVRFLNESGVRMNFAFRLNGRTLSGWESSGTGQGWSSRNVPGVEVARGDEIEIDATGEGARIDYVQLTRVPSISAPPSHVFAATGPLDDPEAMPGGLIVAGTNPGYLKLNGGRTVYLSGPDDPETFFYRGTPNPDGTRFGGQQSEIITRLAGQGVTAFHCQIFRMRRCNIKDEGDDTHSPFLEHDPTRPLNPAVLDQWETWISQLENAGIVLHLEFYNDATDVERMGWTLGADGNLHPDERRFIAGIVERFKHHRNILWGLEESSNKIPRERTAHFKKMAALIAEVDNFNHPIVQSFVIPSDPEGDDFRGMAMSDDYVGDPNIRVVTWLHLNPHGDDLEMQHREYLRYARMDGGRFVVMKNETFYRPYLQRPPLSRQYIWAAAMAGMHMLEAQHKADRPAQTHLLKDDGLLARFMETTDFFRMRNDNAQAHGSTKWVLCNPGQSWIAYSYAATSPMGVRNLPAGSYDLLWFDCESGREVVQRGVESKGGAVGWPKPDGFGGEVAVYIGRTTRGPLKDAAK